MNYKGPSPIEQANAATPDWMRNIRVFDALEIHPCAVVYRDHCGIESIEQCSAAEAQFWTVYGHLRTGGLEAFGDYPTEAEACKARDQLLGAYWHLRLATIKADPAAASVIRKISAAFREVIRRGDDLIASIDGCTDQFERETAALSEAIGAGEGILEILGLAAL